MTRTAEPRPGSRRGLLVTGLLALLLVASFALWMFPYTRLAPALESRLAAASGAQVELGELGPELGLRGPFLVSRAVRLRWPDGQVLDLERAAVRPALSTSWLRGEPALVVDLRGAAGQLAGTVWPGERVAFRGRASDLDPALLPERLIGGPAPLTGRLDATLDLATSEAGVLHGQLAFQAREGTVIVPDPPLAVPYTRLSGELSRAEAGETTIRALQLEGPLVSLEGSGSVGAGPVLERAPLALEVTVRSADPALRPLFAPLGVPLDASGSGTVQIRGTLDRPVLDGRR